MKPVDASWRCPRCDTRHPTKRERDACCVGGPWRNPCPVCGASQPPCNPSCGFNPTDEDIDLP